MTAPVPADLPDLAALATAIRAVLAEREEALRDAEQAAADLSYPPHVHTIYQAAAAAWRRNVAVLRADLAACEQGLNPYKEG